MATLKLIRPDEKTNRLAEMKFFLNGQLLGSLLNNEARQFEVPPGRHRLVARIDSQGSKAFKFKLAENEAKNLVIITNNKANTPEPLLSGTFLDIFVSGFLLLYYFTTGHNRYLVINELKTR